MSKINIRSATPTFRRAGITFTRQGTEFTKEQWDALGEEKQTAIQNEVNLSISPVKEDDEDAVAEVTGKKGKGK
jgi:hypothetical protein